MSLINYIRIINFKGISVQTVYFSKTGTNFKFGKNGIGKTSFLEAVRFALTGKKPKNMLKIGESYGSVFITFNDPNETTVLREFYADEKKPNKVKVNDKTCTAKEAQKVICDLIGTSEDKLDVLTSTEVLHELINGNLGAFLLDFLGEDFDLDSFYSLVEFSDKEKAYIRREKILPKCFDVQIFGDVYKTLFAQRAEFKKAAAAAKVKVEAYAGPEEPFFKTEEDMKKAEEEYIKAKFDAERVEKERKKYTKASDEYMLRMAEKVRLESAYKVATEYYREDITDESLVTRQNALNEVMKNIYNLQAIIASNTKVVDNQTTILKALDTDICPISSCLVCRTDKTKAKADVEEAIREAQNAIDIAKKSLSDNQIQEKAIKADMDTIRKQLKHNREYLDSKVRYESYVVGEKPEKPELPETTEPSKDFLIYKQEWEEYSRFIANKEEYIFWQEKLDVVSSLTQKFSPKGVVNASVMKHYCDIFNETAETYTEKLGCKIQFVPDNGVQLFYKQGESEWVNFANLSSGEKLILSIIVYVVLNTLLGTEIILLDNFNDLDKENVKKVKALFDEIDKDFDNSLMVVTGCNSLA